MDIILPALIVILSLAFIYYYNRLVRLSYRVENAWSQIDVQLKRRHDLIPNLVEVAKGYMAHERNTLENVAKARSGAQSAASVKDKGSAENYLTDTLRSLFAVAENYPQLKADKQMLALQEQLTHTENRIAFSRIYYNDEVMRLNTLICVFPSNIIAVLFRFAKQDFFELEDISERNVTSVDFEKPGAPGSTQ